MKFLFGFISIGLKLAAVFILISYSVISFYENKTGILTVFSFLFGIFFGFLALHEFRRVRSNHPVLDTNLAFFDKTRLSWFVFCGVTSPLWVLIIFELFFVFDRRQSYLDTGITISILLCILVIIGRRWIILKKSKE